jgi:hypothetical protein
MSDPDRRDASLDLTGENFRALLGGVTAVVEQEVAATRSGACVGASAVRRGVGSGVEKVR